MSRTGALAAALAALVPLVQMRVDARLGHHRAQEEVLYLWSGEHVGKLYPGFQNVVADIYWLRTVQYFGGQRVFGNRKFDILEPLVDITVSLDPRFEIAYRYGATFLSEPWPIGAGDPEAGVRILERGARALPRSWLIRQSLGFFIYFHLGEPARAARVMLDAARLPGAPSWFETMAADFLAQGGQRETARRLWRHLYDQAEEGPLKRNAQDHLLQLDAQDLADELERAVSAFAASRGRNPATLGELVETRLLPELPLDPAGSPFAYDAVAGKVSVSRESRLWRAPLLPRKRKT